jgi:uncharacterized protein YpmS
MVDEVTAPGVAQVFLQQGIMGALVIVLGIVAWKLFQLLQQSQEKRIEEAKANATALLQATTAIEQLTELIKVSLVKGGA